MPTEGALLMSRRTGGEPIPIDFNHREHLRHMAELLDENMPSESNCIHFPSVLTFRFKDTQRQLPSSPRISTLDRKRLKLSDCMHLSPRTHLTIRFLSDMRATYLHTRYTYPTSPAFLYYHLPPGLPDTAGEVRIQLTPDSDPKNFDGGIDLIEDDGIWRLPLVHLVGDARYASIRAQLLSDGFITPELLLACEHLWTELNLFRADNRLLILHSISQEFFIRLTARAFTVIPVNRGTAGPRCVIDCRYTGRLFAQGTTFPFGLPVHPV
jgi:hypothetical protein